MKKKIVSLLFRWGPAIVWATVMFYFSHQPVIRVSEVKWWDFAIHKIAHLIEYAVLYILTFYALRHKNWQNAIILVFIFALTDEIHQDFIPGRECKVRDIGFDSLGAFIGVWLRSKLALWLTISK